MPTASPVEMDRQGPATDAPAGQQAAIGPPSGFVLVVDDEPLVAAELAAGLADMGYAADHALGAAPAMQLLAARPEITVLVTDIRMPGTDGIALARAVLAARDASRALSVVLITGHATPEDLARAMPGEEVELIRKPFRLKEIGAAVERAHRRAAARRSAAATGC